MQMSRSKTANQRLARFLCLSLVALIAGSLSLQAGDSNQPPNVIIILADDLGYSDLGCYGSEIQTPNLDELASGGLRYTQFYNTARCWPTRAALLTGYYPQQVHRDALPTLPGGSAARFRRPAWAPLLPHLLRDAGYRSYYSGKWHVDGTPAEGGFDRSYELQDQGRYFRPRKHVRDGMPLPASSADAGYYSTTAIAEHAVECLREHQAQYSGVPFFQYVAFTAPHFPLQAPSEDIARYADRYAAGWDSVRVQRWQRMAALNLVSGSLSPFERTLGPPYAFPEQVILFGPNEVSLPVAWQELTESQQDFQTAKMAIHAAMVDRMDREIGRICAQLRTMGVWDNTLLLFLSDNGASAEMMVRDDGHNPEAPPGSAETHLCLGPGWSTVCNTPFRRHKTWVHEGGISTPLIAHWPAGILARGELRHDPGHVIDVVPTLLQLSRTSASKAGPQRPGISLVDSFGADGHLVRESLWWLHEGNRALRSQDWKIVAAKDEPWALYDLRTDRAEQHDLTAERPEIASHLIQKWNEITEDFTRTAQSGTEKPRSDSQP